MAQKKLKQAFGKIQLKGPTVGKRQIKSIVRNSKNCGKIHTSAQPLGGKR